MCLCTIPSNVHTSLSTALGYSTVSSPLDRSKRFTCFALPGRPVHSDTNSASPGSILAMQQLRATTKSVTFPPLYNSQVLIDTAESNGASMDRTKMPNLRNGTKGGFEPGLSRLRVRHSTTELPHSISDKISWPIMAECIFHVFSAYSYEYCVCKLVYVSACSVHEHM